jgi:hypothetical protein
MPYLPGRTLRAAIEDSEAGLAPGDLAEICASVADGLAFLHERNIAHRDLNPRNIYICESGEVLILDFGLVKLLDQTSLTRRGQIVGTLAYCSPEQLRGESGPATDLYALGATLFHGLCGRPPFLAENMLALIEMIRGEDPEPPSVVDPRIPESLEQLTLALLAKEPVQRPGSALAVATDLRSPHELPSVRPRTYARDSDPILAVRAATSTGGRALVGAAMLGEAPQIAVAALTTPGVLGDIVRAGGFDPDLAVLVDTRVETTRAIGAPKAVVGRSFAPTRGRPYLHGDLRSAETCRRIARGDLQEQAGEGATILRSSGFSFAHADDPWIKRDARLLGDALSARDALAADSPLFATIRCELDALQGEEERLRIANRFSRGLPQGYWLEIYGLTLHAHPEAIAAALEMCMLMQERGVPSIPSLPGPLVELAWSIGIGGAEVKLGRVGGAHAPTSRPITNADRRPRFELLSVFGSFAPEDAAKMLAAGILPESDCGCPTCRLGGTHEDRVTDADSHDIFVWRALQRDLCGLSVPDRLDRLEGRLTEAELLLDGCKGVLPKGRGGKRHLRVLRSTLAVLADRGVLAGFGALRPSA